MPPIPNLNWYRLHWSGKKGKKKNIIEEVINWVFHFDQELELALYK